MEIIKSFLDYNLKSSERWPREYYLKDSNNTPLWTSHPSLDEAFIKVITKAVIIYKSSHLLFSRNGEKFDSFKEVYDRL